MKIFKFSVFKKNKYQNKMKIYTKRGDTGSTDINGSRIRKDHIKIEILGTIDELNSYMSLIPRNTYSLDNNESKELFDIQALLIDLGSYISGYIVSLSLNDEIVNLENLIDHYDSQMPALKHFILFSGETESGYYNLCRTSVRKLERLIISTNEFDDCIPYINRLSDYFFVKSRYSNFKNNVNEVVAIMGPNGRHIVKYENNTGIFFYIKQIVLSYWSV